MALGGAAGPRRALLRVELLGREQLVQLAIAVDRVREVARAPVAGLVAAGRVLGSREELRRRVVGIARMCLPPQLLEQTAHLGDRVRRRLLGELEQLVPTRSPLVKIEPGLFHAPLPAPGAPSSNPLRLAA